MVLKTSCNRHVWIFLKRVFFLFMSQIKAIYALVPRVLIIKFIEMCPQCSNTHTYATKRRNTSVQDNIISPDKLAGVCIQIFIYFLYISFSPCRYFSKTYCITVMRYMLFKVLTLKVRLNNKICHHSNYFFLLISFEVRILKNLLHYVFFKSISCTVWWCFCF